MWDAPEDTISKRPLQVLYSTAFSSVDINMLSGFFRRTLGVPDMSCDHIITELKAIKQQPATRIETVRRFYHRLHETLPQLSISEDSMRPVATHIPKLSGTNLLIENPLNKTLLSMSNDRGPQAGTDRPSVCGRAQQRLRERLR